MDTAGPHIVVLGAGFGGLSFCHSFPPASGRITLVDRQNHHLFQPLLYQVATAGLSAPDIAQPIRSIMRDSPNVTVLMDNTVDINLAKKTVYLESNTLEYDYLVLALGGVTSYFGHPEWEEFAPGLKSLDDALRIRRNILFAFERAENTRHSEQLEQLMTIVVVGGGPTGVELAGAFAELARFVLTSDFKHIEPQRAKVILLEGSPTIMSQFPPELQASARSQLENLGVQVRTPTRVKVIRKECVELEDGSAILAANIIWAAGVAANPLNKKLGVELDRASRIKVQPDLSIPGHPEAFAVGDLALSLGDKGKPVPGVSPAAMQMAKYVAGVIRDELSSGASALKDRGAFEYWDKGTMATIGRSKAVAKIGRFEFSGFTAWLTWLGVHLIFLVGFRNKIAVLFQWAYSYFTYKRGARIITGLPEDKSGGMQSD